ncbi:MAG: RHS repeat-associated core domain-containing protein, partial [Anaeroplasmataceae bacterium]
YDPEVGRFISPDSMEYLDPESINGLNLYAYCGNNPVNMVDHDRNFAIFTTMLITSIVLGFTVGAVGSGIAAYKSERSYDEIALAALGGGILGGAFGAAMVLGGAAGLAATGAVIEGFTISTWTALGISVGITSVASLGNYFLDGAAYDKDYSITGALSSTIKGGIQGLTTFGLGFIGGKYFHIFDKMVGNDIVDIHRILTIESKKGLAYKILLGTETLLGPSITRGLYFGGVAWLIRKIIDWMM